MNIPPQFAKFMREFFSDKTGTLFPAMNLVKITIPLDAIFTDRSYAIQGDMIFLDRLSTGNISIKFNNTGMPAFPMTKNLKISGFPIKELFVSNLSAQAGMIANLWVGYGTDIVPPNEQNSTITGIVSTSEEPITYGTSFESAAILGAVAETIVAAAANLAGIDLWDSQIFTDQSGGAPIRTINSLHSHTAAPAAFTDGDIHLIVGAGMASAAGKVSEIGQLNRSRFITTGKGLYFFTSSSVETTGRRSVLYNIL